MPILLLLQINENSAAYRAGQNSVYVVGAILLILRPDLRHQKQSKEVKDR